MEELLALAIYVCLRLQSSQEAMPETRQFDCERLAMILSMISPKSVRAPRVPLKCSCLLKVQPTSLHDVDVMYMCKAYTVSLASFPTHCCWAFRLSFSLASFLNQTLLSFLPFLRFLLTALFCSM